MKTATIPFSGFYNSIHDDNIDQCISQMFSDRETGCQNNPGLESALFDKCDFQKVHMEYAKSYTESFADNFKAPSMKFESLQSPEEYNFTTDRIFVTLSKEDISVIFDETWKPDFDAVCADMFTTRPGFISLYSPRWRSWGPIEGWDANQLGALLASHAGLDFDMWAENDLMERAQGNGYFDNWVSNATPNIERLYKIHDYLETRAARHA